MKILISGGAGYIGSHTALVLLEKGHEVVVVDNLSNSSQIALKRVEELTGKKITFYPYDLCDESKVREVFDAEKVDAVIHFAAVKAVGESVSKPLEYYSNNLISTMNLLRVMRENKVNRFIFSSSATVYGAPEKMPITEDFPLSATNPYGYTKIMNEQILKDYAHANPDFDVILLRYFNPVGAHESGRIGEDPNGIPKNLTPYILRVAVGKYPYVDVNGNDFNTPDGTGIRDYIHVMDLADGHVSALEYFENGGNGLHIYNLGSGKGLSVLEVIAAFSKAVGREIPYEFKERRPGDSDISYGDASKANRELNWTVKRSLDDMCRDAWKWQKENPDGYTS